MESWAGALEGACASGTATCKSRSAAGGGGGGGGEVERHGGLEVRTKRQRLPVRARLKLP